MTSIEKKLKSIDELYELKQRKLFINEIHPLVKLIVTLFYIVLAVSIDKYDLERMILMSLYIIIAYAMAELSVRKALWRLKLILPLVIAVGIFNPIFDHSPGMYFGNTLIYAGWISMLTLMLKGIYSVLAAYLLIAVTGMEEICYALRLIHVPKVLVTVILLTYRYISILGSEADRIMTAYRLRAPKQKGINYKVWGPMIGQWMLRSFDKAGRVYDAMLLRGFKGEFPSGRKYGFDRGAFIYLIVCAAALSAVRFVPLMSFA